MAKKLDDESNYSRVLRAHLRKELPEWYPEEIIDRTVTTFDKGEKMNLADFKNAPIIAKGLAEYIKNEYNPTVSDGKKFSYPAASANGAHATTWGNGQGADLMFQMMRDAKGTRMEQAPEAYWPGNANVQYGNRLGAGVLGYVDTERAPNTAFINPNFHNRKGVGIPAHELEHTRPAPLEGSVYDAVSPSASVGYERGLTGHGEEQNEKELNAMVAFSSLRDFVDRGLLPANALENNRELFAALVGRESQVEGGKSVQEDEVMGAVLKTPKLRDWYLQNRFRDL